MSRQHPPAFPAVAPASEGRLLIHMATYNERDNLAELVQALHAVAPHADILVTDDNSPDGTGRAADALAAADPRVRVIHRSGKLGLGTAILGAMRYAIEHNYDLFLNLDADFSHPPRYLPGLVAGMRGRDVMIGSRYVSGGTTENWPWSRKWISVGVNWLVRTLFGLGVRDASGGFRCYRVAMLRRAPLDRLRSRGYSFQQEVLFRCWQAGAVLGETPIVFENRKMGKSKVNWHEVVRSLSFLVGLGVRNRLGLEGRAPAPRPAPARQAA
jgi:dolichol-phosphate mannosyltransferase